MLNYCLLPRTVIELSGNDNITFLQSLITQDIQLLKSQSSIFTLLLTNKGRYLLDFFIIKNDNSLFIDIATSEVNLFIEIINRYKLRAKVNINIVTSLKVFSIFDSNSTNIFSSDNSNSNFLLNMIDKSLLTVDNRTPNLGLRLITSDDKFLNDINILKNVKTYFKCSKESDISITSLEAYTIKRYMLAVPENTELVKEKSIPLECNFENLNAISFNKGCYLGQEFTNASKRTLVISKSITTFTINKEFRNIINRKNDTEIKNQDNIIVGKILGICDIYVMSLMKIESLKNKNRFFTNNIELTPLISPK